MGFAGALNSVDGVRSIVIGTAVAVVGSGAVAISWVSAPARHHYQAPAFSGCGHAAIG